MTDDKFDDLNEIDDEEEETFEDRMLDALGERSDRESDAWLNHRFFSRAYRRFLDNGCRGILTYEEAVEEYRIYMGCVPDTVTDWPHLDWLKERREKESENDEAIRAIFDMSVEEYLALYWPYEPLIKYAY